MKTALSLLKVGVDLDGVLNNMGEMLLAALQAAGSVPAEKTLDDVTDWHYSKCFPGVTEEMVWEILKEGEVFWNAVPDPLAREVMQDLHDYGVELHIVTSRDFSGYHRKITEGWLREHGFPYDRLEIVVSGKEKLTYANQHRIDVVIEDKAETAVDLARNVRLSLLLDRPYNRGIAPVSNLRRVYSWGEIRRFFTGFNS